jgi:outer membrane protein assembly factor BamB
MRRHTTLTHSLAAIAGGVILAGAGGAILSGTAHAQFGRGAGEWNTAGGDAHRSGWVRGDAKISRESLAKPGFAQLYKIKLDGSPRQQNGPTEMLIMTGYIGYRGFRSLGYTSVPGDKVYAFDIDLGRIEWQKAVPGASASGGTAACPGGITSNVARVLPTAFPPSAGNFGRGGRGAAAKSAVGDANEGAVYLKEVANRPAPAARGGRGPAPAGGFPRRQPNYLHVLGSDGVFHNMYVSNGDEPEGAIKFIGPNANAHGLLVADGTAYVATTGNCGGVADGVWALDLESKKVANWAGKVAGSEGVSLGPDGTVYVSTTTGDLVALEAKTLKVKEVYQAKNELTTSPVVFQHKDKTLAAAASKDGNIHIVDVAKMSAPLTAPAAAGANGAALASWQDGETTWLLVPGASSVSAWKLVEQNGAVTLQKGWTSRDITSPVASMIINGVVFAASAGTRNAPTVLYAMDGGTGKELWNSGKSITSSLPKNGGLSGGGTQVYLGTSDGTLYAFGFPMEH